MQGQTSSQSVPNSRNIGVRVKASEGTLHGNHPIQKKKKRCKLGEEQCAETPLSSGKQSINELIKGENNELYFCSVGDTSSEMIFSENSLSATFDMRGIAREQQLQQQPQPPFEAGRGRSPRHVLPCPSATPASCGEGNGVGNKNNAKKCRQKFSDSENSCEFTFPDEFDEYNDDDDEDAQENNNGNPLQMNPEEDETTPPLQLATAIAWTVECENENNDDDDEEEEPLLSKEQNVDPLSPIHVPKDALPRW